MSVESENILAVINEIHGHPIGRYEFGILQPRKVVYPNNQEEGVTTENYVLVSNIPGSRGNEQFLTLLGLLLAYRDGDSLKYLPGMLVAAFPQALDKIATRPENIEELVANLTKKGYSLEIDEFGLTVVTRK